MIQLPARLNKELKGVFWFIACLAIGCGNDVIGQYLSEQGVHSFTIAFARLSMGSFLLIPWLLYQGRKGLQIEHPAISLLRGALTFLAMFLWIQGVSQSSVVTATLVGFTMPIFDLFLGSWLLGENRKWYITLATWVGLGGACLTLAPSGLYLSSYGGFFGLGVCCFSLLDVISKHYASRSSHLEVIFATKFVGALCALLPLYHYGELPPPQSWSLLGLLGLGGNLLLYCLFKAYEHAPMTSLAPLRYLELFFSISLQYLCFEKLPTWNESMGSFVILPTSLLLVLLLQRDAKEKRVEG